MSTRPVPFETTAHIRDTCLCLHAQRAARRIGRRFDQALRPFALTNGQFSLLMSLNRPEPARMAAVAELLAVDRTTLTAALKPLQRRGLVEVTCDPADRRTRLLTLTPAGLDLLAKAVPVWRQTHAQIDASLPEPGPDPLRRALAALG